MGIFWLIALATLLIAAAVKISRMLYVRGQADRGETEAPEGIPFVVAPDPETGKLVAVIEGLETMRATWHPIRFPHSWESRAAGLPAEKATFDAGFNGRRAWCEKHCQGRWRLENPTSTALVFWFENHRDAADFSLAWYPFKCV